MLFKSNVAEIIVDFRIIPAKSPRFDFCSSFFDSLEPSFRNHLQNTGESALSSVKLKILTDTLSCGKPVFEMSLFFNLHNFEVEHSVTHQVESP